MEKKNKPSIKSIYGIFMVFFYLCISILLIFTPIFENVNIILRIVMGVLFFGYGLFRGYRMWKGL
ncbi:MAG: hypothetical protein E6767_00410 [Dysgonomonas sp.]|nr:hypothetical protein [Dysgonomonas sp.]